MSNNLRGIIYRGNSGTTDYTQLSNKPAIDGNTLIGDQTAHDLGLANLSDIPTIITDYTQLSNKPAIDGNTLTGDQTAHDLGLAKLSDIPTSGVKFTNIFNTPTQFQTNNMEINVADMSNAKIVFFDFGIQTGQGKKVHLTANCLKSSLDIDPNDGFNFIEAKTGTFGAGFEAYATSNTTIKFPNISKYGWGAETLYLWNVVILE